MANTTQSPESSGTITPPATLPAASGSVVSTLPVVMGIVALALIIALVGGDKALRPFLWLVLLSMVVTNAGTIADKLESVKGVIQR